MAKKSSKRNCKDNKENKKKKQSSKKSQSKASDNDSIKFSDFTYAELIVLAATLSYSLAEKLDEEDLEILLVFLGILLANMQLIITQKSIEAKSQNTILAEEDIGEGEIEEENIDIDLGEE